MLTRLAVAFALALSLTACPRETQVPLRAAGPICASYLDCVPDGGMACGALVDCVDEVCAAEASLTLPCP